MWFINYKAKRRRIDKGQQRKIIGCNNQNIKFNVELILGKPKDRNCSFKYNCFWSIEAILKS